MSNLEKLTNLCPQCGGKTVLHDRYARHVHVDEEVEWIVIQRVICVKCKRTHAIIPDFIRPYKHYSACDCELALRDIETGLSMEKVETAASTSTLKRWVKEFKERGQQAAGALRALLNNLFDNFVNELSLSDLGAFDVLERILVEFPEIESSHLTIGETNLWITNFLTGIYV